MDSSADEDKPIVVYEQASVVKDSKKGKVEPNRNSADFNK